MAAAKMSERDIQLRGVDGGISRISASGSKVRGSRVMDDRASYLAVQGGRASPRGSVPSQANGRTSTAHHGRRRLPSIQRMTSLVSFVSIPVKYSLFFFNFLVWLSGLLLLLIGSYVVWDQWRDQVKMFQLKSIFDILFNIGFLLLFLGFIVFLISFAGCMGALRENKCLLKFYSLFLLLLFLTEMVLIGLSIYFNSAVTSFLEHQLSDEIIKKYRDNAGFKDVIDGVQLQFGCCGTGEGYKDWNNFEYFSCPPRDQEPVAEQCNVPKTCCLLPRVEDCNYRVQRDIPNKAAEKINIKGCIPTIQAAIRNNFETVGGIGIGVAFAQLLIIYLARTLEGQITAQKARW